MQNENLPKKKKIVWFILAILSLVISLANYALNLLVFSLITKQAVAPDVMFVYAPLLITPYIFSSLSVLLFIISYFVYRGEKNRLLLIIKIFLIILIPIILISIGYRIYTYVSAVKQINNTTVGADVFGSVKNETEALVEKVGLLINLPTNETPSVATVTNKDQVKDQPGFKNAENGDKTLIYTKANKIILYRPSTNELIDVMSLNSISQNTWKTYNTIENGWRSDLEVTLKYPTDWYNYMLAGGIMVYSMLADYSFNGLTNIMDTPKEYCRLTLGHTGSYDNLESSNGLIVTLENKYIDVSKNEKCDNILNEIKQSIVSKIQPISFVNK